MTPTTSEGPSRRNDAGSSRASRGLARQAEIRRAEDKRQAEAKRQAELQRRSPEDPFASPARPVGLAVFGTDGHLLAVTQERREMVCSLIGLTVKLGLVAVAGVSLVRLAGAYQQRMDRNGEIVAVLELEKARLARARERFDHLFMVEGEQRLIREQSQWIAPDRLRVIWQTPKPLASSHPPAAAPATLTPSAGSGSASRR